MGILMLTYYYGDSCGKRQERWGAIKLVGANS